MYDTVLKVDFPENVEVFAYADDLLLIVNESNENLMQITANQTLFLIEKWACQNKIVFNSQKSQLLHVSRRRQSGNPLRVYLWGGLIKEVKVMKYLGVWFDQHLSWAHHVTHSCGKAGRLIHALSRYAKVYWGIGSEALETIYNGAVLPALSYGVPVWAEALNRAYNVRKLRSVQRKMILRVIKGYKTISFEGACMIAKIMPIDLYLQCHVDKHSAVRALGSFFPEFVVDTHLPPKEWAHPVCVACANDCEDAAHFLSIYTDGSKSDENVGCAFVALESFSGVVVHQRKFRLAGWCSNNQAEMLAILASVEWLSSVDFPPENRSAVVYSDSAASLAMINSFKVRLSNVELLRKAVSALKDLGWRVSFRWIKAHNGVFGNELADNLAKEASMDDSIPFRFTKVPISHVEAVGNRIALQRWEAQWQCTENAAHTRRFFPHVVDRLKAPLKLTFKMTQVLSNHGKHAFYLHRFGLRETPDCDCLIGGVQDWDHLIFKCEKFEHVRSRLLRKVVVRSGTWPPTFKSLVEEFLDDFTLFLNGMDFEQI